MSTIDEIVYKRLREGDDPGTVRKSVSSMSQYARGVQRYIEWSHSEVVRLRNQVTTTFTELKGLEQQVRELQGDRDTLEDTIENFRRGETTLLF